MTVPSPALPADEAALVRGAVRRIRWRVLPPLVLATVLLLLDRTAVATLAPQLGASLGLGPFGVGLTTPILFLGILLFEVPSALIAARVGARTWLACMAVTWGAAGIATGLATGPGWFFAARAVASLAQAGFIPVAVFVAAGCVPPLFRTRMLAWVVLVPALVAVADPVLGRAVPGLGGVVGGLVGGVDGWRWPYLVLGAGSLGASVLLLRRLPAHPADMGFLPARERDALAWMRSMEPRWRLRSTGLEALLDPRVLLLAGMNLCFGLSSFAAGTVYGGLVNDPRAPRLLLLLLLTAVMVATVVLWSRRVDRTGQLFDPLVIACALGTIGYLAGMLAGPTVARLTGLVAHGAVLAAARCMLFSAGSRVALGGGGAASLALIDATGLVGAFIAPRVLLGVVQQAGHPHTGLLMMAGALVAATGLAWLLKLLMR